MCIIELVDYNEAMLGTKDAVKAKPTRRRRASGKKKDETAEVTGKATVVEEVKEPKAKKSAKKPVEEKVKESEEVVDNTEISEPVEPKEETTENKE